MKMGVNPDVTPEKIAKLRVSHIADPGGRQISSGFLLSYPLGYS